MYSLKHRFSAWTGRPLGTLIFIVAVIVSYAIAGLLMHVGHKDPAPQRSSEDRAAARNVNPFQSDDGTHLIAFVVTASDCGWSKRPKGMEATRTLRERLRALHSASYAKVSVVGVALDQDPDVGLRFLAQLSNGKIATAFDQVIVGGRWLNEQIVRFVWREHVGAAITPQILVIERPIDTRSYLSTSSIGVQPDTVVANPNGELQIVAWLRDGAPLKSRVALPQSTSVLRP